MTKKHGVNCRLVEWPHFNVVRLKNVYGVRKAWRLVWGFGALLLKDKYWIGAPANNNTCGRWLTSGHHDIYIVKNIFIKVIDNFVVASQAV